MDNGLSAHDARLAREMDETPRSSMDVYEVGLACSLVVEAENAEEALCRAGTVFAETEEFGYIGAYDEIVKDVVVSVGAERRATDPTYPNSLWCVSRVTRYAVLASSEAAALYVIREVYADDGPFNADVVTMNAREIRYHDELSDNVNYINDEDREIPGRVAQLPRTAPI